MTRSILLVLVLVFGSSQLVLGAEETEAAEASKAMDQLMADRKAVAEAAAGLRKSWEENEATFKKNKQFIEHEAKQKQIQQNYIETDKRLQALDKQIVDRVVKERGTKESK